MSDVHELLHESMNHEGVHEHLINTFRKSGSQHVWLHQHFNESYHKPVLIAILPAVITELLLIINDLCK